MAENIIPDRKTDKTDQLLKVSEAADRSAVSPKFIHEAINKGELKAVYLGNTNSRWQSNKHCRRIYESELIRWWRQNEDKPSDSN